MFVCENLSADGICLSWASLDTALVTATSEQISASFLSGFGIIMVVWGVGFAIGTAVKMIRMA